MTQAMKDRAGIIEQSRCSQTYTASKTLGESHDRTDHAVYDRRAIAHLSCAEIEDMSCSELIQAIRKCRALELRPEANRRLEFFERRTLEQLIYILRRMFQEQELRALSVCLDDEDLGAVVVGPRTERPSPDDHSRMY